MFVNTNRESREMVIEITDEDIIELKNGNKFTLNNYPFNGRSTSILDLPSIACLIIKYKKDGNNEKV